MQALSRRHKIQISAVAGLFFLPMIIAGCGSVGTSANGSTASVSGAVPSSAHNLTGTPASLSFGNVMLGSSSSLNLTLSNSGTSDIVLSAINVTGAGFAGGSPTPLTVRAGSSSPVVLSFAPQVAGGVTGSVSIVSNASNSPLSATLSGTGVTNSQPPPSSDRWVMGYYADWQTSFYPVNRIDFSALTHIALAHWLTNADGTVQTSSMETIAPSIIAPAHAAGVKAMMMLGGSDDVNYPKAASAANRATLVRSILAKIDSLGLDGVDLDWELNTNSTNLIALAQALRQARPTLIVTAPIDPSVQPTSLAAGLAQYCDQVNMMTYGNANAGAGWVSWYFSALGGDGPTHPTSVNLFVNDWLGAGVPAAKIGVGIGFYAEGWTTPVTGALQNIASGTVPLDELPYGAASGGVLSWFYNQPGSNYLYDSGPAQQPSISIPSGLKPAGWSGAPITWVTFEDEASIAAKAAYVNNNNLGGAIIWTLGEGATDPIIGRNPLLDSVKLGFLKNGPAPMPLLATSGAVSVGGATTITLTGLSSSLGQVNVSWWNGTTVDGWDRTSYGSGAVYGLPSEYYIEASTDGSTWVQLSHITGEHYAARQFVYDWSGTGYVQLRMRIISIIGSNAGQDTFSIHSSSNNSTDSYLLLGDSITANCWAAANNTFPTEQFGAQIHAAKPSRYPVVTEAGQSGWLASTALNTTTYGKPNIQQWLSDYPAVKFVGLSFGTNDANGGVAAATYCSTMQSLTQYVIAAGKTPIIPTIVASPSPAVQTNGPAMNACLASLESKYPSIIKGPDLWTLFAGHSVNDGWFFDDLHPSLGTGCTALQNAWVSTMKTAVYPQ